MKNSVWKRMSLACALSGLLFSASAYAANVSYDAKYNGHCYKIVDTGTTWGQARAACERQGGHLVTITSSQEQSVVASLLRNKGRKNNYWLGGLKSGSRWQWITGESFSYSHWSAGQPDNFQGRENCLSMYRNRNPYAYNNLGEWNDAAPDGVCNNEPFFGAANFGYICEWDSDPNTNTNSVDGRLKGDVNGDGKVDKSDVNMLQQYIVGLRSSLPCPRNADMNGDGRHTITDVSQLARLCPLAGDVNGDGKIDYSDAEMLKQYIIGDRPSLPYPKNADANEDGEITVADVTKIVAMINPIPPNPDPVPPDPDPVPEKYVVSTNGATLALRSGSGTNYSIKTRMRNRSVVDVYSINNGWADCSYNGQRGYASAQYLRPLKSNGGYLHPLNNNSIKFRGSDNGITHDYAIAGGTPVYASCDGTAYFYQVVGYYKGVYGLVSYGNYISLKSGGVEIRYGHLQRFNGVEGRVANAQRYGSTYKKVSGYNKILCGQKAVNKGEIIGYVGTTGNSSGNHLHIEVWENGKRREPNGFFG